MNLGPDLKTSKINVLTHEQVKEMAAAQPEPEDVAPATFEAEEASAPVEIPAKIGTEETPVAAESSGGQESEGEVQSQDPVSELADQSVGELETVQTEESVPNKQE